ncbi:MAG TPA: metallophosphoesterase [Fimbriimonadaceae bacterium]|nr:metallophosphoesterase [Fimbriimonadaceae bacterium]
MPDITLVHTNDLHGKLTQEKAAYLGRVREKADFYFDTGDLVRAGNLAVPVRPDAAWPLLASLDCSAMVPGNRESHPLKKGVNAKFQGCETTVVCANWKDKKGKRPFPDHADFETKRIHIAVFGVMVPMVTERMATQAASQYLWDQPVEVGAALGARLKKKADFVIALTHIGLSHDRRLAQECADIDLILGGHSHNVLEQPEVVNGVPICQGGSHARFIGRYTLRTGKGLIKAELLPWP